MVLVIVKAFDILEFVAQEPGRAHSLTEIAETMQMNQATCVNILKTLVEKNYLEHLGRKKGYRLGPMAYNLTNNLSYSQDLVLVAKDIMEDLTHRLNETSILGVLRNQKRFIVHLVNSDQDLQVRSRTERNIYETASGRLLLAFMPVKERENLINTIGYPSPEIWPEATTFQSLESELGSIQANELSVTRSKTHIIGLAVPVHRHNQVIASLSIFLPEIRFSDDRKKEIEAELRNAAQLITRRLSVS